MKNHIRRLCKKSIRLLDKKIPQWEKHREAIVQEIIHEQIKKLNIYRGPERIREKKLSYKPPKWTGYQSAKADFLFDSTILEIKVIDESRRRKSLHDLGQISYDFLRTKTLINRKGKEDIENGFLVILLHGHHEGYLTRKNAKIAKHFHSQLFEAYEFNRKRKLKRRKNQRDAIQEMGFHIDHDLNSKIQNENIFSGKHGALVVIPIR